MRSLRFWVAVAVVLLGNVCAFAQSEPNLTNGFTPYGSYHDDGVGAVNLMNGNLTSHIPHPQHYASGCLASGSKSYLRWQKHTRANQGRRR